MVTRTEATNQEQPNPEPEQEATATTTTSNPPALTEAEALKQAQATLKWPAGFEHLGAKYPGATLTKYQALRYLGLYGKRPAGGPYVAPVYEGETGVNVQVLKSGRVVDKVAQAKAEAKLAEAPPPTTEQQAGWEAEAQEKGLDPLAYSQSRWFQERGVTPKDIAQAGLIMPGVTRDAPTGVRVAPSPAFKAVSTPEAVRAIRETIAKERVAQTRALEVVSPYINPKTRMVDVAGALKARIDRGALAAVVGYSALRKVEQQIAKRVKITPEQERIRAALIEEWGSVAEAVRVKKAEYDKWLTNFTVEQRKAGYSDERIVDQIAEIQSGRILVYSPELKKFVPTYREVVEQREIVGYAPRELDEIYSGSYKMPDINTGKLVSTTKAIHDIWVAQGSPTAVQMLMQQDIYREFVKEAATWGMTPSEYIEAKEKASEDMERYKTEHGYDLLTAIRFESPDTMRLAGFEEKDIKWAQGALSRSIKTSVALPGEKNWHNVLTGEVVSDDAFKTLVGVRPAARDEYVRATPEVRRMAIQGISTMFFSPTRMLLPEVIPEDIKPSEYAVGAGQLALWAIPFLPKGVATPLLLGAGGTLGYNYAKNYKDLGTGQKILGASLLPLIMLPVLSAGVRTLIPVAVSVPTKAGIVTVWKGISIAGKPIIGISQKKLAVGAKGISLPKFATVQKGYIPVTKLETSMVATRNALKKMGATDVDIIKVEQTLKVRDYFVGKKSPYLAEQAILQGSERITPQEMAIILKQTVRNARQIESVYGSSTIPPQLRPELLKIWRKWHDVDIQTTMTVKELEKFTKQVATALRKAGSDVKIDPTQLGAILKRVGNKWEKITDFHSKEKLPGSPDTLEGAYGMLHAEPVVKIKLPGIGEFQIMRLSETGKRKIASVLEFQEGKITPPPHRTNDLADLYIIIRNFKGQKVADQWAKAWGMTPDELLKIAQTAKPSQLLGWKLVPSTTGKGSPTVAITPPPSMMARLSPTVRASIVASLYKYTPLASPEIALSSPLKTVSPVTYSIPSLPASTKIMSRIIKLSSPLASSKAISRISPMLSVLVSSMLSRGASSKSISVAVSKSLSPYVSSGVISPSISGSISSAVSKSLSVSPSPYPSLSPSPSPSPSSTPSPIPSPVPSPYPSPVPSPYPSPVPVPLPRPYVPPPPPPPPPSVRMIRGRPKLPEGSIAWATGELSREGGKSRVPVWKWIAPPWTQEKPFTLTASPIGARNIDSVKPHETIQMIGKPDALVPERITVDQGAVDLLVSDGGKRIEFFGGGLKTDYGKRLASPTKGISIPGGEDLIDTDIIPGMPVSEQEGIDRTKLSKRKPKRKVKRKNDFSDITSLQGIRW